MLRAPLSTGYEPVMDRYALPPRFVTPPSRYAAAPEHGRLPLRHVADSAAVYHHPVTSNGAEWYSGGARRGWQGAAHPASWPTAAAAHPPMHRTYGNAAWQPAPAGMPVTPMVPEGRRDFHPAPSASYGGGAYTITLSARQEGGAHLPPPARRTKAPAVWGDAAPAFHKPAPFFSPAALDTDEWAALAREAAACFEASLVEEGTTSPSGERVSSPCSTDTEASATPVTADSPASESPAVEATHAPAGSVVAAASVTPSPAPVDVDAVYQTSSGQLCSLVATAVNADRSPHLYRFLLSSVA